MPQLGIGSDCQDLQKREWTSMRVGSKVRVIGIPDGLEDYPDFPSKSTFIKCVGREFIIAGFNEVGMAELDISSVKECGRNDLDRTSIS
jgi:hypothetical protein